MKRVGNLSLSIISRTSNLGRVNLKLFNPVYLQVAQFARIPPRKRPSATKLRDTSNSDLALAPEPSPPAPLTDIKDAWTSVLDKSSGQLYWWNTVTNETTALGAPKPAGPTALGQPLPQQFAQPGAPGLGRVMAEGMAFGVGSSVAHGVVGSMFGGGNHHSSGHDGGSIGSDSGGDDGGDWDI
jgi:hypothetical protein